jgi:hypothetical protein
MLKKVSGLVSLAILWYDLGVYEFDLAIFDCGI